MTYLYYNISIRLYSSLNDFKAVTQGLEAHILIGSTLPWGSRCHFNIKFLSAKWCTPGFVSMLI